MSDKIERRVSALFLLVSTENQAESGGRDH